MGPALTTLILAVGQVDGQGSEMKGEQKSDRAGGQGRLQAAGSSGEETANEFII